MIALALLAAYYHRRCAPFTDNVFSAPCLPTALSRAMGSVLRPERLLVRRIVFPLSTTLKSTSVCVSHCGYSRHTAGQFYGVLCCISRKISFVWGTKDHNRSSSVTFIRLLRNPSFPLGRVPFCLFIVHCALQEAGRCSARLQGGARARSHHRLQDPHSAAPAGASVHEEGRRLGYAPLEPTHLGSKVFRSSTLALSYGRPPLAHGRGVIRVLAGAIRIGRSFPELGSTESAASQPFPPETDLKYLGFRVLLCRY